MRPGRRLLLTLWICALAAGPAAGELEKIAMALPGAPPLPLELRHRLARELASRGADYRPRTHHLRSDGSPLYSNRLLLEASPYLQQHAHNPVDWHPWGDEAFETARRLGRPVLVSIGYSTCHWCHVMEEESFDQPEIARILNEHFIAIKVDREVRPDVDAIYMSAIHALTGDGGWPLNVWMTPDREPFFAGTYFPPRDRDGRPGLPTALRAIHEQYARDRERISSFAGRLAAAIRQDLEGRGGTSNWIPDARILRRAKSAYARNADRSWGGIRGGTKFPSSLPIRMLLRYHRRTGDEEALRIATLTLEKMAAGGMYDHLGGGFHRYATDPRWLVPHFEKMLYDNARLALDYLEAWQATGREEFARVTREILDYVAREMTSPEGGFYSATDADSAAPGGEVEEGRFFTWTPGEIEDAVGTEAARVVSAYYGVSARGDHQGRSVLHVWRDPAEVANRLGIAAEEVRRALKDARPRLYRVRQRRPPPLRDEKILAAWNGMMISAFARSGFALDEPALVSTAERAADFVLERMRRDGRLARAYQGGRTQGPAFLEDYAFLIAALLDLYEAAGDPRWIREARALQQVLDARYADAVGGGYFKTADDHEPLLAREKPGSDASIPSGNSVAALNLLRLHEYTGDDHSLETASRLFSAFRETLETHPTALSEMLLALDYRLDAVKEVVVVRPAGGDASAMLAPLRSAFAPNRILSLVTDDGDLERHAAVVPIVSDRRALEGKVTAYLCENRVCRFPTSDPSVFAGQLAAVEPLPSAP